MRSSGGTLDNKCGGGTQDTMVMASQSMRNSNSMKHGVWQQHEERQYHEESDNSMRHGAWQQREERQGYGG